MLFHEEAILDVLKEAQPGSLGSSETRDAPGIPQPEPGIRNGITDYLIKLLAEQCRVEHTLARGPWKLIPRELNERGGDVS